MMDNIDKKILTLLQQNDKISYHNIAKKLNLAPSTIHNRIKRIKKKGIIKNFSAIIDLEKAGYESIAWLGLSVNPLKLKEVAHKLVLLDKVQIVATSTGDHDIVIQVIARDEKSLWKFINDKIKTIDGIKSKMDVSGFIDIYKITHVINFN